MVKTLRTGITKQVMDLLRAEPKDLWTWGDILEEIPESNEKAVQNCIHRLYVEGKVMRHIDSEEETRRRRYAMEITPAKRDDYVKIEYTNTGKTTPIKRKKGSLPSSKEIRTAFAQTMTQLAKLEDMVSDVVELAEDTERKMKKIENLLR